MNILVWHCFLFKNYVTLAFLNFLFEIVMSSETPTTKGQLTLTKLAELTPFTVADFGGRPHDKKFSRFHAVFRTFWQIRMLAQSPPQPLPPPPPPPPHVEYSGGSRFVSSGAHHWVIQNVGTKRRRQVECSYRPALRSQKCITKRKFPPLEQDVSVPIPGSTTRHAFCRVQQLTFK